VGALVAVQHTCCLVRILVDTTLLDWPCISPPRRGQACHARAAAPSACGTTEEPRKDGALWLWCASGGAEEGSCIADVAPMKESREGVHHRRGRERRCRRQWWRRWAASGGAWGACGGPKVGMKGRYVRGGWVK
jgi:hypothetical protein